MSESDREPVGPPRGAGGAGGAGQERDGVLAQVKVPASIEILWGLRDRPGRGPRPALSLAGIVGAAITVVERDGLGSLSMNRIATELKSAPMSLYRYIGSKDELLALMVDAGVGAPPPRRDQDVGWRAGLSGWTSAIFERYRARPWIIRVPITGPPITPNQISWLERALQVLAGTGLTEQEKLSIVLLLSGFARSQATMAADFAEAARDASPSRLAAAAASYGQTLGRLIDPAQFPAVSAAIASGDLDDEPVPGAGSQQDQYVGGEVRFGLERILDGVQVLIDARLTGSG